MVIYRRKAFCLLLPTEFIVTNIKTLWCSTLANFNLSTLKNSQSSVTLENECKQLRYHFPNEI